MRRNLRRCFSIVILAAVIAALAPVTPIPAAADETSTGPINDDFADAVVLDAPATWEGDTTGSTSEPGEPKASCAKESGTGSVWFRFTPTETGTARITVTTPEADLLIASHTGDRLDALSEVDCTDGPAAGTEVAHVPVSAGSAYSIAVAGWTRSDYGAYTLTLELLDPPANDNFSDAVVLEVPASWDGDTTASTSEPGQPTPSCAHEDRTGSVWFRFTAPQTGMAEISVQGSFPTDFVIAAYRGTRLNALTEVHCGQQSWSSSETAHFGVSGGTTYSVAVAGASRDDYGEYQLTLDVVDAAANADFAEVARLDLPGTASGTTRYPANEVDYRRCSPWTRAVWYRIDPPDGEASVTLVHSDVLELGVYVGDGEDDLASLRPIDCVDLGVYANVVSEEMGGGTATTFPVADGRPYYLQVIQTSDEAAEFALTVDVARRDGPSNDHFGDAAVLAPSEVATGSTLGATVENGEARTVDCGLIAGNEQSHKSGTVWYQLTPATDQVARLRLSSAADLGYAVFEGPAIDDLAPVACRSRRAPGLDEVRDFHVQGGTTYRVLVRDAGLTSGDPRAGGDFTLKLDYLPFPGNDSFSSTSSSAYALDGTTEVAGDTGNSSAEAGEPIHKCSLPLGAEAEGRIGPGNGGVHVSVGSNRRHYSHTVWYRYEAAEDGLASISVSSESDQAVALYYGENLDQLGRVQCVDTPLAEHDTYTANIAGGRTYYVAVVARDIEETGAFTLGFRFTKRAGPVNDDFADAAELQSGTNVADLTGATTEFGEPVDCQDEDAAPSGTIWFRFTVGETEAGLVRFGVADNAVPTTAIYKRDELGVLTNVVCAALHIPEPLVVPVTAGTYYVSIAPVHDTAGSPVTLEYALFEHPANDDRDAAEMLNLDGGDSAATSVDGDTRGATAEATDPKDCFTGTSTMWYRFTAPEDGLVRLALTDATPLRLAVYEESTAGDTKASCDQRSFSVNVKLAAVEAEAGDAMPSSTTVQVGAGATYSVMVVAESRSHDGPFTLSWEYEAAPDNDDFANAEPIVLNGVDNMLARATVSGDLAGSTGEEGLIGATSEDGEEHCGRRGSVGTVWYRYTPAEDGAVAFGLTADERTWAAVYKTGSGGLSRRACVYSPTTPSTPALFIEGGSTYWVAVGRYPFTVDPSPFLLDISSTSVVTGPTVEVNNASVVEGTGGTTTASFRVALSHPSPVPVTVRYQTASGDAIEGRDFGQASGVVEFAPGEASKTIEIEVITDHLDEEDQESFTVDLTEVSGAVGEDLSGTGTIIDDDAPVAVSVADASAAESRKHATSTMTFALSLDKASGRRVTVGYQAGDATAIAGSDYIATSGVVEFAPGETTKTVTVTILGDHLYEGDETLHLVLSDPGNVVVGDGEAAGTIVDDDPARGKR